MITYTEHRRYSPGIDAEVVRLSMAGEHNAEYWMEVPASGQGKWRDRRDKALDAIEDAIGRRCPPGEVRLEEYAA
jgi:hypothetical protein